MQENFKGTILHSADYTSASEWKGKHGVVVGTANTGKKNHSRIICVFVNKFHLGHDVAEDMVESGLSSVTMIQRSPTCTFSTSSYNSRKLLLMMISQTFCPQNITQ